jgi:formiminotetrahydrofolate cyclodeaminase
MAAALAAMVAGLTVGRKRYSDHEDTMQEIIADCAREKNRLLAAVQKDTDSFMKVMAAFSLPKESDEQKQVRKDAIQEAMKEACSVPLHVMRSAVRVLAEAAEVAVHGNSNALSDGAVGVLLSHAALEGAALNVRINLKSINDAAYVNEIRREVDSLLEEGRLAAESALADVWAQLDG